MTTSEIIKGVPVLLMLIISLIYADFAIWYCAEMHNIWEKDEKKKKKFRGILHLFWDWLDRIAD